MATVKVMNEVVQPGRPEDSWRLALQHAEITFSDGRTVKAYRFVCRQGLGKTEHEAHFPSLADAEQLIRLAKAAGWGDEKG